MVRPTIGRRCLSVLLVLPLVLLGLTGCGGRENGTLTVFAAASLSESFSAIGKLFEQSRPDIALRFSFGGSARLAYQIKEGAPADVFAAANMETMRQSGVPSFRVFARNRLQIAVPKDNPARITGLHDLARPGVKVALCAPQVPCGAAAATALAAAGVTVEPVSLERDVKATLTKVRLGEVDAGLVYRTDVTAAAGEVEGIGFTQADKAANAYPIGVVPGTSRRAVAEEFIDLVLSDQGRRILADAGFTLV